ncbi:MAG: tRNA glutamyl-Q(34) synthetase GluQRS [Cyanobacteria bacterium MAG IRC4_bin_6]|nr:tRNA glutamyl-Q(34) synthetase GluQRS [Cyanobacteria bacterium MAG IRC4_bin_6]
MRARFAPTPSGPLHLGNLRTALLAWLHCRLQGGVFLLRIDDLDRPRLQPGAEDAILRDLRWLGLDWDEGPDIGGPHGPYRQSGRRWRYHQALSRLRRRGLLFPCRCSRRLLAAVSAPHAPAPLYPGTCRNRQDWGPEQGKLPSWRWRAPSRHCHVPEMLRPAPEGWLPTMVGDVVLRRADGFVAYHLATAVDEMAMGITQVFRGADLLPTTAVQVALMEELGGTPPRYWHGPLLLDRHGQRLAKRAGSMGVESLRQAGRDAPAVVGALAASVGLLRGRQRLSAAELLSELDLPRLEAACQTTSTLQPEGLSVGESNHPLG